MFDAVRTPMTISAGVAQFSTDEDLESLFARAEAALYTAKASGRDRVMLG